MVVRGGELLEIVSGCGRRIGVVCCWRRMWVEMGGRGWISMFVGAVVL